MKLSLKTLLCAALLCVGYAQGATQYWANGVNAENGWYDANKSYKVDNDGDDMMCYAASASNLIAWWQSSLPAVPVGTPMDLAKIWKRYQDASKSNGEIGGNAAWAMAWWISGVYSPTTKEEAVRWGWPNVALSSDSELAAHSGYYYDLCSLTSTQVANFVGSYINTDNYIVHSYTLNGGSISGGLFENKSFAEIFEAGYGVSLGISDKDNMAHAITLWGVEYNDEGQLSKLWLTDSDDSRYNNGEPRLVEATVYSDNSNPGRVYFSTETVLVPVEEGGNTFWAIGYEPEEKVYIDSVYVLNPKAFSVPVPEPATATLSLLALAGLAVRRRRK